MKNLVKMLLIVLVLGMTNYGMALVIEDGSGSSAAGDWTLDNGRAVAVIPNGGSTGNIWAHNWDPVAGSYTTYSYPPGYTSFWHEGLAVSTAWVSPSFTKTSIAGDLSANMNGSVKLSMRTNDWVHSNYSVARLNNVQFIFDGSVGGAGANAVIRIACDQFEPYSVRNWSHYVMHDLEINLDGGLFTTTGSTYPMGTHTSLSVSHSFGAADALEFWQNISSVRIYMQACSMTAAPGAYDSWMDIDNFEIIPEPATMVLLGLGGLLLRRKR